MAAKKVYHGKIYEKIKYVGDPAWVIIVRFISTVCEETAKDQWFAHVVELGSTVKFIPVWAAVKYSQLQKLALIRLIAEARSPLIGERFARAKKTGRRPSLMADIRNKQRKAQRGIQ